jgi:hypothetical protein
MNQTTESKKEEFRKYLETSGVIDQLTKVLVGLYEEPDKPNDAVEFIKKYLGSNQDIDVNQLQIEHAKFKHENELLKRQIRELQEEIESLKQNDD